MAAQPDVKRAVVAPNNSENKSRGGRPPGSRDTKPRVQRTFSEKTGFDYSRVKFTVNRMTDFAAYLAGYPNKSGLKLYVYRVKPKIDLGLIGVRDSNIRITTTLGEMTEDFIGRNHGRGMYTVKLNDVNREGITEICKCTFEADDPEFPPPIYDIRTLCLGEPGNQDEVSRQMQLGNLVRDAVTGAPRMRTLSDAPASNPSPAPSVAPAPAPVAAGFVGNELLAELIRAVFNRATDDPRAAVKDTIEMARLLNEKPATPAVDVEQIVERVAQRLGGSRDDFDIYERVAARVDKMRERAGLPALGKAVEAATGETNQWAGVMASLPGVIRELRSAVPEIINSVRGLRVEVGGREVARIDNPAAGSPAGRSQMTMKDRIAEVAQMAFENMTKGVSGFDFAVYICTYHPGGLDVYRFLMPGGTLGVLSLCAMDDVTRSVVNDATVRPQLELWLDNFFTFDPDGGVIDEGDHAGAPSAAAGSVPAANGSAAAAGAGASSSR